MSATTAMGRFVAGIFDAPIETAAGCCGDVTSKGKDCCASTAGKEDRTMKKRHNDIEKQEAGACGPGCSCGTSGSGGRGRLIAGIVILLVAGVLLVRAAVKDNGAQAAPTSPEFAALAAPEKTPEAAPAATAAPATTAAPAAVDTVKEIASFSELNKVAADKFGVFLFLPGKSEAASTAPMAQIRGAARTIEPQLRGGGKIGVFALKVGSPDYEQVVASKIAVPGVLALVKGAGMSAASGDITETKLVQAFVAASRTGGCGAGGCAPGACK